MVGVIEALVIVGVVGTIKKVGGCAGEGAATAKQRWALSSTFVALSMSIQRT